MKFSEMKYNRPNFEEMKEKIISLTSRLKEAKTYEEAREIYLDFDKESRHHMTAVVLTSIRHSIDTKDEFYDQENKYWDEHNPLFIPYRIEWSKTLLESPFRKEFEKEFGDVTFINSEIALRSFKEELIPLMQEENKLSDEYSVLISSAQIPFEGKTYTLSQLSPFKDSSDDEQRLNAWKAEGKWFKDNQDKFDEIYDKLVHIRDEKGKILGHKNFIPLGYDNMERNCYNEEDVEKFRKAVREYIVPIADKIFRKQAKRIGKEYPLSYADAALSFRSGNPKPQGSPDDILMAGKKFYDELSPETSEFFNTMLDNELLDVLSKDSKMGGGYCTALADYEVPFIFANFNGTQHDVEVLTHEAGHAFEAWLNLKRVPVDTVWASMEASEVHSMSMEFFAWPWTKYFFGDDTRKYLYTHLSGALKFIPYGTLVDHYQHEVYRNPDYTPKQRHELWKSLQSEYMPWIKLDGDIPFYSEGEAWQRQSHIYGSPFYYIDYCLAQTVALLFWKKIGEDKDNAWKQYMEYTKQGGSRVFTELLKHAGLESPFDEETLKGISQAASDWLDNYDLSGIE